MALLAAIGLLVLLVVLLHRHQTLQMQHNADRNLPLPPLRKAPGDINRERLAATPAPTTAVEPSAGESDGQSRTVPETPEVEEVPNEDRGPSWYEQLAQLKRDGQLTEALLLCRREFPLWSAFQQAMLVKRAQIKLLQQADQDFSADLKELYHIASVGSLLHDDAMHRNYIDRVDNIAVLSVRIIARQLERRRLVFVDAYALVARSRRRGLRDSSGDEGENKSEGW